MSNYIKCILDSNRGVYIPKNFVDDFDLTLFENVNDEAVATCKLGPDCEGYWDAWIEILNVKHVDEDGTEWSLHQDGDLFMVALDKLTDADFEDFFEVSR